MNRNIQAPRFTSIRGPLRFRGCGIGVCTLLVLVAALAPGHAQAAPFSTAFTYQGTLEDGGLPANGPVDFQFRLFDAAVAGAQIGSTVTANGVQLEDGAFTIELDFGAPAAFNGEERWLEIVADGTTLSPRQRLSPTPYANLSKSFAIPQSITTDVNLPFELINTNPTAQARGMRVAVTSPAIGAIALFGEATSTTNENVGVLGRSSSSNGFGVAGDNLSVTGNCTGVYGNVASTSGNGVLGYAHAPTGATRGVYGKVESADGHAGYFEGRGYVSDDLGVGVTGPDAKLEISGQDPTTGRVLNANDQLYVVASPAAFVGVGRTTRITGAEVFGIHAEAGPNTYGGMYVETGDANSKPFYGYATNGAGRAWTYWDGVSQLWRLYLNGDRITVGVDGLTGIGRVSTANRLEVEGGASKTVAGSWLANSDARIKTDVVTIGDALTTLDKVRLVSFRYTDDYRSAHPDIKGHRYLNVIAQEFREVFPDHVRGSGEKLPNGEEILQVDTYPITIYTAAAVQELHRTLAEKNTQIAGLEARVARLEGLVTQLAAAAPGASAPAGTAGPGATPGLAAALPGGVR